MILQPLLLLWLLFGFIASVEAKISYLGYKPKGMNPTLYDPKDDPIVQLDQNTFTDTVFCSTRANCSAFIVEFYSDWCGHCRDYSSIYKAVARDVKDWNKVVTIAAINCADPTNSDVCRDNEIYWYPAIKYFPRNARSVENSSKIRAEMSVAEMRDQITTTVLTDYAKNRYPDWPKFTFLPYVATYTELWRDVPKEINMLAIVFENSPQSPIGAQLLMDLMKYNNRLFGRRSLSDHPLAKAHHILDFPTLTVFKRGEKSPVLKADQDRTGGVTRWILYSGLRRGPYDRKQLVI
ncbi:hypothetical protein AB6A40_007598 [Gnathostoma spinigerum]|uniref:Thioredoxin domain-containing protein n=1 Tax=Gnathostoma spinigerum TaxID=75299 RepID=A0ABD6ERU4_9BILA